MKKTILTAIAVAILVGLTGCEKSKAEQEADHLEAIEEAKARLEQAAEAGDVAAMREAADEVEKAKNAFADSGKAEEASEYMGRWDNAGTAGNLASVILKKDSLTYIDRDGQKHVEAYPDRLEFKKGWPDVVSDHDEIHYMDENGKWPEATFKVMKSGRLVFERPGHSFFLERSE